MRVVGESDADDRYRDKDKSESDLGVSEADDRYTYKDKDKSESDLGESEADNEGKEAS